MISVSTLLCETPAPGDRFRYGDATTDARDQDGAHGAPGEFTDEQHDASREHPTQQPVSDRQQRRPVVVWNVTRQCNLHCAHCYAAADCETADGEFSTAEGERLLDDLADYGVRVVLFSGGEPLVRDDLAHLVSYATDAGLRAVLSTNGTLLTPERARELRDAGLAYAGVSVDGMPERNDDFRGQAGAFDRALEGIHAAQDAGLKTGLRYTITERNADDLDDVVALLHDEGVDRFCFYHLDYGGRGTEIVDADLTPAARREAVRRVCDLTRNYHDRGDEIETLLVGNYADAGFLVEYAREHLGPERAERIRAALARNGGDPAGERVADVDYQGNVHLTQFWQGYSLGNVRDRPFGAIWEDESNPLLQRLRDRPDGLTGRCGRCQYADLCRGGSRLRALTVTGYLSAPDPQCYLTENEIAPSSGGT